MPLLNSETVNIWNFLQITEEEFNMRIRGGYNQKAAFVANDPASASVYGVKKQSISNHSNLFHVVDGLPSDIMHDMLE